MARAIVRFAVCIFAHNFKQLLIDMFWNYVIMINVEQFDLILLNIKRCLTR